MFWAVNVRMREEGIVMATSWVLRVVAAVALGPLLVFSPPLALGWTTSWLVGTIAEVAIAVACVAVLQITWPLRQRWFVPDRLYILGLLIVVAGGVVVFLWPTEWMRALFFSLLFVWAFAFRPHIYLHSRA